MLTRTEMIVLLLLLQDYGDVLSCRGSNDCEIDDTPANREFIAAVIASSDYPDDPISTYKGKIQTQDYKLVAYFEHRLKEGLQDD